MAEDSRGTQLARTIGLFGATGVGVGAIVGGGILVLGGVAFAQTGPSAIVAFALNGVVALLTALSFAELSSAFPESGGAYTFAKKVHSVRAAFAVGWILWFASIVAAVLYALGFATYATLLIGALLELTIGFVPPWLSSRAMTLALSIVATGAYVVGLLRRAGGGGNLGTLGKVVVFCVVISFGAFALFRRSPGAVADSLVPFFTQGAGGLLSAMGFTFIALQGFDLIAAVGGEVKKPEKTIPRAMLLSLAAALLIYLPLLFLLSTVGTAEGRSIADVAADAPETVFARAVEQFMGGPGFWLVVVAAILSTLTALKANLFAASRVALTMARDRTLPAPLGTVHPTFQTPRAAIYATALTFVVIVLMLPDVAAAGAAASLIFLVSFAIAHWTALLARRRSKSPPPFRTPLFPAVPVIGGTACVALAVFQAVVVPSAGLITLVWLGMGIMLFLAVFSGRAHAVDAFAEARDPGLVRLRGRSPLTLVPVANPQNASALVDLASVMSPPTVGRVLLLSVVAPPDESWDGGPYQKLLSAQEAQREAVLQCFQGKLSPEVLLTVANDPWDEIGRMAGLHRCESLVLGLSNLADRLESPELERLMNEADCDVTILRAPAGWGLSSVRRILVPLGGGGGQNVLRARLLGGLGRSGTLEVRFLRVLRAATPERRVRIVKRQLQRTAGEEAPGSGVAHVLCRSDAQSAILEATEDVDLVVLGVQRHGRRQKAFGEIVLRIARDAPCATVLISRRG